VGEDQAVYEELLPVFEQLYTALLPANTTLQEIGERLSL
jgi:gluconokinase